MVLWLYKFVDSMKVLPNTQFSFRKGFGNIDAFFLLTHSLQSSDDKRAESRLISFYFSFAFNLVNHQGILNKLKTISIGGPIFKSFKDFFFIIFSIANSFNLQSQFVLLCIHLDKIITHNISGIVYLMRQF